MARYKSLPSDRIHALGREISRNRARYLEAVQQGRMQDADYLRKQIQEMEAERKALLPAK